MPKVKSGEKGCLALPDAFFQRRHMPFNIEYWLDEREGDLVLHPCLPGVRKLYIQPTTRRNLHCRTFIRNVWKDPESQMPMRSFQRLLESLDDLPHLTRVVFSGFGEPLLHPNILEMIEEVRKHDLAVTLGSNGLLLEAKMAHELVKIGVDRLVVSVDDIKP